MCCIGHGEELQVPPPLILMNGHKITRYVMILKAQVYCEIKYEAINIYGRRIHRNNTQTLSYTLSHILSEKLAIDPGTPLEDLVCSDICRAAFVSFYVPQFLYWRPQEQIGI